MVASLPTIFFGALAAIPAVSAASVTVPRQADAVSNSGFLSFPIKRGERSSRTLSGRQASASLVNEADTSYLIECKQAILNVPLRPTDQTSSQAFLCPLGAFLTRAYDPSRSPQ